MDYSINSIEIDNFKSYATQQIINISDLSVLLGANSSGKSTALQALLVLKQTMECNSPDVDLLLSGKYVALGEFDDVIFDKEQNEFRLGISFSKTKKSESDNEKQKYRIEWHFHKCDVHPHVELSQVDILYGDRSASFIRDDSGLFQFIFDESNTSIYNDITNLRVPNAYYIEYDCDFNQLFANLINEVKEIKEGEKTHRVDVSEMVSMAVPEFYFDMMQYAEGAVSGNTQQDDEIQKISEELYELIEKYNNYQNPIGIPFIPFPAQNKKKLLSEVIKGNSAELENYQHTCEKYEKKYDEYVSDVEKNSGIHEKSRQHMRRSWYDRGDEKNSNGIFETYLWIIKFYKDFEKTLDRLFFLGPIRENPKGLYNIGFETVPKYVGPTGSSFPSVLLHENKKKEYILPDDEVIEATLLEALDEWAKHLNIASAVQVEHGNSFGINVSVSNTQEKKSDIMNVGIGTSQVLPVLILGLLSEKDETLVFEQPELHLHPYSQSRLADFFVELVRNGRKVIVETHSEAFILRLRYHILSGNCNKDNVAINFFENNKGTKVSLCDISEYGTISYPDDFKDETQELLNNLMNAVMHKKDKQ